MTKKGRLVSFQRTTPKSGIHGWNQLCCRAILEQYVEFKNVQRVWSHWYEENKRTHVDHGGFHQGQVRHVPPELDCLPIPSYFSDQLTTDQLTHISDTMHDVEGQTTTEVRKSTENPNLSGMSQEAAVEYMSSLCKLERAPLKGDHLRTLPSHVTDMSDPCKAYTYATPVCNCFLKISKNIQEIFYIM